MEITAIFSLVLILSCVNYITTDKPCAARVLTAGESVVCVCNATYCDDFIREVPAEGSYVVYTSSKSGLRFNKEVGTFQKADVQTCPKCSDYLDTHPDKTYQTIEGFGGSVTDSAAINWKRLGSELKYYLVKSYFSTEGLEYNMIRLPIGGTDFSTHPYAYNEEPRDDVKLSNFTLSPEDYNYRFPLLHAIFNATEVPVHIVATTWSPPPWMKTNNNITGFSHLKKIYYQTYADYHIKFIEKCEAENIPIWAITTTDEPVNGLLNLASFNTLGWTIRDLGNWILNYLGPTLRSSKYKDVKILTCDDQRYSVPFFFNVLLKEYPAALDYIDGVAVHYYADAITPASVLDFVTVKHPEKFILSTEASEGSLPWETKVLLGSWDRAVHYINDILEDLNHNVVGWIDWNLCLDMTGGPNWVSNFVDSPVIVSDNAKEFYKQPMFYALGHVSKFVPRGSVRIGVTEKKSIFRRSIRHVAFLTPRNTTVIILENGSGKRMVRIKSNDQSMVLNIAEDSITTIEFATKL